MTIELIKAVCGIAAWVALCLASCVAVCAVIYNAKPEENAVAQDGETATPA